MHKVFLHHATTIILSVAFTCFSSTAVARSEYWEQKVSLFDRLPVNPGDIVFLGNSITDGGEFSELFGNGKIKNRGISSDVIAGVRERLRQVTSNSPAKIFLLIGINDISHNRTIDSIADEYRLLVEDIRTQAPETELYIQSVMPVNNDFARYKKLFGKEEDIRRLNARLKRIADENDASYIDLWECLADPVSGKLRKEFTNDGLHLLGSGYQAWADAIRNLVEQ